MALLCENSIFSYVGKTRLNWRDHTEKSLASYGELQASWVRIRTGFQVSPFSISRGADYLILPLLQTWIWHRPLPSHYASTDCPTWKRTDSWKQARLWSLLVGDAVQTPFPRVSVSASLPRPGKMEQPRLWYLPVLQLFKSPSLTEVWGLT